MSFRKELEQLINRHSMGNGSDTPDFLLADYLEDCLAAFDRTVKRRDSWYGRKGLSAKIHGKIEQNPIQPIPINASGDCEYQAEGKGEADIQNENFSSSNNPPLEWNKIGNHAYLEGLSGPFRINKSLSGPFRIKKPGNKRKLRFLFITNPLRFGKSWVEDRFLK